MLHRAETALAQVALWLMRRLSPAASSTLFGGIARSIGPWLPVSRVADANLQAALPELDAAGRRRVVRGVWENLGRTVGELPHLGRLGETPSGPGWEVVGGEVVAALRDADGPALLFSGHIGNWEVLPVAAGRRGLTLSFYYRSAENRGIDALMQDLRRKAARADVQLFPKGSAGARRSMAYLRQGGRLAMLMDQKMNDGIEARFFGRPAMTAPALAMLALRFGCPVVPALVERIGPARFRVTCEPPLVLPDSGDRAGDILALTQAMNDTMERWIRAKPESWLWLHNRWPKDAPGPG